MLRHARIEPYYSTAKQFFHSVDDYQDYGIIHALGKADTSQCNMCPGLKPSHKNSDEKDLAVNILFGTNIFNILTWVRTLRSSGCRCKILFFADPKFQSNFNKQELEYLSSCGVVWWITNSFVENQNVEFRMPRFFALYSFLEAYAGYFNRILYNDIFDTIFQSDPFTSSYPKNKLVVSIEKVQFGNHDYNTKFVLAVDGNYTFPFWRKKWIINCGITIGPSELLYKFLSIMIEPSLFLRKGISDQAIYNYLYYTGVFPDFHVDIQAKYLSSACYSIYENQPDKFGNFHELNNHDKTPSMIHQYDRICPIIKGLSVICPPIGPWHRFPGGRPNYVMQKCGSYVSSNIPITIN